MHCFELVYKHTQNFHELCAKASLTVCGFSYDDSVMILFDAVNVILPKMGLENAPICSTLSSLLLVLNSA